MLPNAQPVRIALKTLHDSLVEEGTPMSLLQADLALLMAIGDHLNVQIDYEGLCQATTEGDFESLDRIRTELNEAISSKRDELGQIGIFDPPW